MEKCRKCGCSLWEAADRGAFFKRVSPIGEDFIGECSPSCQSTGTQDDALLRALEDNQEKLNERDE